jgi:hypothetical protein
MAQAKHRHSPKHSPILKLAPTKSASGKRVYRPLQFDERSQNFVSTHDELFSVAMRVYNPDRSTFAVYRFDPAQAPTGFAEIVSHDFPVFQWTGVY